MNLYEKMFAVTKKALFEGQFAPLIAPRALTVPLGRVGSRPDPAQPVDTIVNDFGLSANSLRADVLRHLTSTIGKVGFHAQLISFLFFRSERCLDFSNVGSCG